jgi:hypothetical protein
MTEGRGASPSANPSVPGRRSGQVLCATACWCDDSLCARVGRSAQVGFPITAQS